LRRRPDLNRKVELLAAHVHPRADWCSAAIPALPKSFRLRLDLDWPPPAPAAGSPWEWTIEDMPMSRNQGTGVLLPNGHVLLVSGNKVRTPRKTALDYL
jgi:hypothetical protein